MQVTFHGAARTVTGTMHMVEIGGKRILLDCGLYQGRRLEAFTRNSHFPFAARSIDAVVLSHAHIDHCGNLPSLVKQGFRGQIACTAATRDLASVMLRDSADIQVSDASFVNKLRARQGEEPTEPLYTPEEAERTIAQLVGYAYGRPFEVVPGAVVTFHDAGHILGSAIVVLELTEKGRTARLGFSGDLGRRETPILCDPTVVTGLDYLITESTYGDQEHEPVAAAEARLARLIRTASAGGGHTIIPSFALGRTQELVYALHRQRLAGALPDVPIYVDSPLAMDVTDVFRLHPDCFDAETSAFMRKNDDPFGFRRLRYVRSAAESKVLNDVKDPFVVIAASGMCESGRVLHHLRHRIENPATTIVMVGFQAENTLGRRLQDGDKRVRIFGEEFRVRANVEAVSGFSAHADRSDLLWWIGQSAPTLKQTFVVHGETARAEALAAALHETGIKNTIVPAPGQSFEL